MSRGIYPEPLLGEAGGELVGLVPEPLLGGLVLPGPLPQQRVLPAQVVPQLLLGPQRAGLDVEAAVRCSRRCQPHAPAAAPPTCWSAARFIRTRRASTSMDRAAICVALRSAAAAASLAAWGGRGPTSVANGQ